MEKPWVLHISILDMWILFYLMLRMLPNHCCRSCIPFNGQQSKNVQEWKFDEHNNETVSPHLNRVEQGYIMEALPHNLTVDWVMQIVGVEEKRLKNKTSIKIMRSPWFNEEL